MKLKLAFIAVLMALLPATSLHAQPEQEKPTVYMVSNAHFDTQWNWTVQQSIDEFLHNTLVQNFALFEEYPDYVFNFEGAVKYRWAKEYYPELFEKLKEYVKAGRWHISGASWDATDPNMPSIESSIRNIMLGQEFYRQEFGVLSTDIMLPDCFGFGWQLPSVAAHCGLIGFGTQKLAWRSKPFFENGMKFPFYFGIWKGLDGQKVMAAMDGGNYTWSPDKPLSEFDEIDKRIASNPIPAAYRYFGTGDKGGSATPEGVMYITEALHSTDGRYNVKFATSDQMYKDYLWDPRLPEYEGELLMDLHATGNYTSKAEMKMLNRRNELMLGAAEGISSVADYLKGPSYPSYIIDEGWKRIIWHQFHDDLTGTSLPACYQFSYNDEYINLRQMKSVIESGMDAVGSAMNTAVKGTPVIVYNSVTAENSDLAGFTMELPDENCKSVEVYGPDGKKVKSQIIARRGNTVDVIFAGKDPSMGLSVYDLRPSTKAEPKNSALKVTGHSVENRIYKVTVNSDGDICSIIDKRYNRELVRQGEAFGYAFFSGNVSETWPAWEIHKKVMDRKPEKVNDAVKISAEVCGPLKAMLRVERMHRGSKFVQEIVLTDGAEDDRIDVFNTVDWYSKASLLKASFPVSFDAPKAAYDLGMGHIMRGNNTETAYEVVAQQWADMTATDGSYGVTIMNDSKYGWDKPDDHTLRLTLFHTPGTFKRYRDQSTQDFGRHWFRYSIVGHKGALDPAAADIASDHINQAKICYATDKHDGKLGKKFSMLSSSNRNLRVKAFKKAQDGDGYIVRVYELSGKGAEGKIQFASVIAGAEEVNGIEDPVSGASFSGGNLDVNSGKFALKTFRIHFAEPAVTIDNPEYETLDIPYNTVAITTDDFTTQGKLGRSGESFAAEIIPDNFSFKGIPFKFGKANYKDALICNSQKLTVPAGTKTLHLLVAADRHNDMACFQAGGKKYIRPVSTYSGFYGVYGWPGHYDSIRRNDEIAYVGTHTHSVSSVNKAYDFSYMYLVSIPVEGAEEVVLPAGGNIIIFSATAGM